MMFMLLATALVANNADPAIYNLVSTKSITAPADEYGEVAWSYSDMIPALGWKPRVWDRRIIVELLGEPMKVAPDQVGWAFAYSDAPDFGVMLVPQGDLVVPKLWDWGAISLDREFEVGFALYPLVVAWLNALSKVHDESHPGTTRQH